jgi:hypothetical protein
VKQKLDELRTLAIRLFEASQAEKRRQPPHIWGPTANTQYRHLPSESIAVWDAVALEAYRFVGQQILRKPRKGGRRGK